MSEPRGEKLKTLFLIACTCGKGQRPMKLSEGDFGPGDIVKKVQCDECGERRDHVVLKKIGKK